ncbi:hypothetical protein L195_g061125 [Trifolium pratense]|uniref:Uncharacterized protein n=1 Tax=Trifolium pratense TaxID=57577 RepID=A0A2K3K7Y7_TRIPR|nr:hypothetical protein L195_g061125 [Trifolium pratense]
MIPARWFRRRVAVVLADGGGGLLEYENHGGQSPENEEREELRLEFILERERREQERREEREKNFPNEFIPKGWGIYTSGDLVRAHAP